jgi:hypothetical protein
MWIDWPVLSIDLRWPMGLIVVIFLWWWWIYESLRMHKWLKRPEVQKHYLPKFRPWYIFVQVWLHPFMHLLALFVRDHKVPAWLVRLGVIKKGAPE